jgi:hypothetical protein
MADHPPMSAAAAEPPPPSVRTSVTLVWTIVALSVLNAALTFLYLDEIVAATLPAQATGIDEDAARVGIVVGSVFFLVIFGALWVMLAVFLRRGANWARIVLTVLAALGVLFGAFGLVNREQPTALTVTSLLSTVLEAALLYCLWQADTSAFIKGRRTA